MGELETKDELNIEVPLNDDSAVDTVENDSIDSNSEESSTAITEYKEVEQPCVALTIIGENRLSDAEVFFKRGIRYSIKAFFSAVALTILNLFI